MKILIVDDEATVGKQLAVSLEAAGIGECRHVAGETDALAALRSEGPFDVLITDVVLEDGDGFSLRNAAMQIAPGLRVVFMSGYDLSGEADRVAGAAVLEKPFDLEAVLEALRAAPDAGVQDEIEGRSIGGYAVQGRLREEATGPVHRAVQESISREVEFHLLGETHARNPVVLRRFIADASVKANVRHPSVLAVYQAGKEDGLYYFTSEISDRTPLQDWADAGYKMDAASVLRVLHTVGEAMVHLEQNGVAHEALDARKILLDQAGRPRIVNIAASEPADATSAEELRNLAGVLRPMLIRDARSGPLIQLLDELGAEVSTWAALLFETRSRSSKSAPKDEFKLDAEGQAALEAKENVRRLRRRRRALALGAISVGTLVLLAAAGAVTWRFLRPEATADRLVEIPAGPFQYQGAQTIDLPTFWIDQHEVTIAQYAQFLAWAHAHPEEAAALSDAAEPDLAALVPEGWADRELPAGSMPGYYARARQGLRYRDVLLTLDSPVFALDWHAAHAYAKWKGRRLPTEQEWEKAAVSAGATPSAVAPGNAAGAADGFEKWAPVGAVKIDKSPYGVQDMAGNVAEWTDSSDHTPVVRGGDWTKTELDPRLRTATVEGSAKSANIGFRTVSDGPPEN